MYQKFSILIAEDNPVSGKMLEKILVQEGHEVIFAENGRIAMEKFNNEFCPIIITDWMMPEMSGPELCKAIRAEEHHGYVYIVLVTANNDKQEIVTGLEAGADDYITKPYNHAELIARLNTGIRFLKLEASLKKANEEIRKLSVTDSLTGSYNRTFIAAQLPKELKRAIRYNRPLSVIFCDIDHFKKINDTFGHSAGDKVLKEFVRIISNSVRIKADWIGRYGGEEFLAVLPETDIHGACLLAERLRKKVEAMVLKTMGETISITASFGVAGLNHETAYEANAYEELISVADQYLYQAKNEGRNMVKGPMN
ncbi:MAG: diguanylate cyclase [Deltaproteobacteria bacterium]|nr:diguanylate cyclase [Deltaproteobacteria bacterium]